MQPDPTHCGGGRAAWPEPKKSALISLAAPHLPRSRCVRGTRKCLSLKIFLHIANCVKRLLLLRYQIRARSPQVEHDGWASLAALARRPPATSKCRQCLGMITFLHSANCVKQLLLLRYRVCRSGCLNRQAMT